MRFECFWIYKKICIFRKVRAEKLPLGEKDVAFFFAKNKCCIGQHNWSVSLRLLGEWHATKSCMCALSKAVRYARYVIAPVTANAQHHS